MIGVNGREVWTLLRRGRKRGKVVTVVNFVKCSVGVVRHFQGGRGRFGKLEVVIVRGFQCARKKQLSSIVRDLFQWPFGGSSDYDDESRPMRQSATVTTQSQCPPQMENLESDTAR